MNAFTPAMMDAYHDALDTIDKDPETRVVVLAANGRGFCSGLDLKSVSLQPGGEHHGAIALVALQELYGTSAPHMRRIRQPIVAAVDGVGVGVGFPPAPPPAYRWGDRSSRVPGGGRKGGPCRGWSGGE